MCVFARSTLPHSVGSEPVRLSRSLGRAHARLGETRVAREGRGRRCNAQWRGEGRYRTALIQASHCAPAANLAASWNGRCGAVRRDATRPGILESAPRRTAVHGSDGTGLSLPAPSPALGSSVTAAPPSRLTNGDVRVSVTRRDPAWAWTGPCGAAAGAARRATGRSPRGPWSDHDCPASESGKAGA